jgi:hypothetical protein
MQIPAALRKLQERDPEFPPYDGNPETFLPWIVAVEEKKNNNKLPDQVAITFAINALGSHARGTTGEGKTFARWDEFVAHLKKRFCPDSFEYNIAWRLDKLRVENGNFQFYVSQFTLGARLLKGSEIIPELQLRYYFIQGMEPDMQAEIINKKLLPLEANIEAAWEYFRKPRAPPKVIVMASPGTTVAGKPAAMDLDSLRYGNSPFGGRAAFDPPPVASYDTRGLPRGSMAAMSASSAGGLLEAGQDWGDVTSSEFLGALSDQREVMFRERSVPGHSQVEADLNVARAPPAGSALRAPGPRGGRPFLGRGGRGAPGRGMFRGGGGGRWPQRPVVRSNSAEAVIRTGTLQPGGATAFAKSPMDEVKQREANGCLYCGSPSHFFMDCAEAQTRLARGLPGRDVSVVAGATVPAASPNPATDPK